MSAARDIGGTLRALKGISVRDAAGTLRSVSTAYARDAGNVLRAIFNSGGVTVSQSQVFGTINSKATRPATTNSVSLLISGGVAPFMVAWSIDDGSWSVTNPTSTSTAFRSPSLPPGDFASATAFATVTDASGTVFTSNTVTASATNTGFSGV